MTYKEWNKKFPNYDKMRQESDMILAYEILGNKCVYCGEKDKWVLEIDHIKPIRRAIRGSFVGKTLYRAILNGKTENLQLLCANCHKRKTILEQMNNWRMFSLD
jgi:5-methylcytosine-specific restriction endonuclease McrA